MRLGHYGRVLADSRGGQRLGKGASLVFTLGLIGYLGYQLQTIGWRQVLAAVPRAPGFYLVFAIVYFCFPLFESAIFRLLWGCPARRSLPALLKKRVYSKYLIDYSGEAYLYLWARRNIRLPAGQILRTLKDNIIISSTTSLLVGVTVLVGLLYAGRVPLPAWLFEHTAGHLGGVVLVGSGVLLLGVKFRRRILSLPRRTIATLFALHAARLLSVMALQVLLWTVVNPTVPLRSWLSLLSLEVLIARIPFLPHRDLVLLGAGLEVAGAIQVALPLLAGMLLTISVLEKVLNLFFFALFSLVKPDCINGRSGESGE